MNRSKSLREIVERYNKVIAHRGCWDREYPENSLEAIAIAADRGFPIEIDVHLTADNDIVVFHDHTLFRMCRRRGRVEEMTVAGLKQCRLHGTRHTIPTFGEVLKAVDGRVAIYVELKCAENARGLSDALLKAVENYDGDVVFIGFNHTEVAYLQTKGYPVCASSLRLPAPFTGEFKPDGMLTNILFTPRDESVRAQYSPFISWTLCNNRRRKKAQICCPAAIYNTRRFKDLRNPKQSN